MTSPYGKFLAPVVVPTGGWDFGFIYSGSHTVTITAGVKPTILELLAELETLCEAEVAFSAWTMTVDPDVQLVNIYSSLFSGAGTPDWDNTDDDLSALLGYDETETKDGSGNVLATSAHTHGWYPGTITFGSSSGASESGDTDWIPDWPKADGVTGAGAKHRVTTARAAWQRTLQWDLLSDDEILDPDRGIHGLLQFFGSDLRYYPDRSVGTVAAAGTQGDPQDDPRDSETDYWLVKIDRIPEWQLHSQGGKYRSLEISIFGQPD